MKSLTAGTVVSALLLGALTGGAGAAHDLMPYQLPPRTPGETAAQDSTGAPEAVLGAVLAAAGGAAEVVGLICESDAVVTAVRALLAAALAPGCWRFETRVLPPAVKSKGTTAITPAVTSATAELCTGDGCAVVLRVGFAAIAGFSAVTSATARDAPAIASVMREAKLRHAPGGDHTPIT